MKNNFFIDHNLNYIFIKILTSVNLLLLLIILLMCILQYAISVKNNYFLFTSPYNIIMYYDIIIIYIINTVLQTYNTRNEGSKTYLNYRSRFLLEYNILVLIFI